MKPHIHFAHTLWRSHLKPGDTVIDATCGNGHDSKILLDRIGPTGHLTCIDIQQSALDNTKARLGPFQNISSLLTCHSNLPNITPHLIVYNLGYLPGGDHSLTTTTSTTLSSLENALEILHPKGLISVMLYTGHPEGAAEAKKLLETPFSNTSISHTKWLHRPQCPSLLIYSKN